MGKHSVGCEKREVVGETEATAARIFQQMLVQQLVDLIGAATWKSAVKKRHRRLGTGRDDALGLDQPAGRAAKTELTFGGP